MLANTNNVHVADVQKLAAGLLQVSVDIREMPYWWEQHDSEGTVQEA